MNCTSAWEYLESLTIAETIKKFNKDIKIVISGWQIKSITTKAFDDSKAIDFIILGDAENTILELYQRIVSENQKQISTVISRDDVHNQTEEKKYHKIDFQILDFEKYPNYKEYMPYVEESRNCPFACKFCLNSCADDRYQYVPYEVFKQNVDNVEKLWGKEASANLLAANFGVNYIETQKKLDYLKSKKLKWNIELHVDNPWEKYIFDLKAAGITKASIGFESGSPQILQLMNKTKDPLQYLRKLEYLLFLLKAQGISVNLNLLIDYRETEETIAETLDFLEKNRDLFHKVKANFMFAFEGVFRNIDFNKDINILMDDYGKSIHAYPILPNGFNIENMSILIDEIERGNYSKTLLLNRAKNKN